MKRDGQHRLENRRRTDQGVRVFLERGTAVGRVRKEVIYPDGKRVLQLDRVEALP